MNSRDPQFTRDDVASRLLIMQFDQLGDKYGRRVFLAPLHENYNTLWSQYLDRLQGIVTTLAERDEPPSASTFRMADWADLATSAAEPLGYDTTSVEAVIDQLNDQQAHFELESEPAFEALKSLMRDGGDGKRYTASELAEALETTAEDRGIPYDRRGAKSLGNWIAHHWLELETTIGLDVIQNRNKSNEYQLPAIVCRSANGSMRHHYFVLDEFARIPHLRKIGDLLNVRGGDRVQVMVTLQSVTQMYYNYGKSLLAGLVSKVCLRANDSETVRFIRESIGTEFVEYTQHVEKEYSELLEM